jgi:hypothetical protein
MPTAAMWRDSATTPVRRRLAATVGYGLGRGARYAETVIRRDVVTISPFKAGAVMAGVWGSIAAITNTYRYKKEQISKRRAVAATASESVGVGLAASLGLMAGNATRMAFASASAASLLAIAVGSLVTAGTKRLWDRGAGRLVDRYDFFPPRLPGDRGIRAPLESHRRYSDTQA